MNLSEHDDSSSAASSHNCEHWFSEQDCESLFFYTNDIKGTLILILIHLVSTEQLRSEGVRVFKEEHQHRLSAAATDSSSHL